MSAMEPRQNKPPTPFDDTSSQPAPTQRRGIPVRFPTVEPILTYVILAVIALVYFYAESLGTGLERNRFEVDWIKINSAVYDGEYYRLFTSMFLHADIMHWGFNSLTLYFFGRDVERLFGHVRFAIIYILGGLAGSVGSLIYTANASLGASGAIFAVISAMAVYIYIHREIYGEFGFRRLRQLVFFGGISIFYGFLPDSRIDNAAHVGGLLGGFILAWFICPEYEPRQTIDQRIVMVDTNTTEKWLITPILFAIGIVVSVAYAASVAI